MFGCAVVVAGGGCGCGCSGATRHVVIKRCRSLATARVQDRSAWTLAAGGRSAVGSSLPPPRPRKGGRGAGPFHSSPNSPALFLPTQPLLPLKFKHPNLLPTPSLHLPPPIPEKTRRGEGK